MESVTNDKSSFNVVDFLVGCLIFPQKNFENQQQQDTQKEAVP